MIAIAGGKGGCGKTTVAVALGVALARTGHRPLLVDADVDMPNLHFRLGLDDPPKADSSSRRPLECARRSPRFFGVDALTAPSDPAALRSTLERCRIAREFVVVDCPSGAGVDAATPLLVADSVLIVTTPTRRCLTDAAKTAAMARELGSGVAGVVVTRTRSPPAGTEQFLGAPVVATIPEITGDILAEITDRDLLDPDAITG